MSVAMTFLETWVMFFAKMILNLSSDPKDTDLVYLGHPSQSVWNTLLLKAIGWLEMFFCCPSDSRQRHTGNEIKLIGHSLPGIIHSFRWTIARRPYTKEDVQENDFVVLGEAPQWTGLKIFYHHREMFINQVIDQRSTDWDLTIHTFLKSSYWVSGVELDWWILILMIRGKVDRRETVD